MTQLEKRRRFSRWLVETFNWASKKSSRIERTTARQTRSVRLEPLESRQLLAADGFMMLLGSAQSSQGRANIQPEVPADYASLAGSGSTSDGIYWSMQQAEGESEAEGESGPDLVAFAKALAATTTKFFGADWCPHCSDQKRLFQDGGVFLPYVSVTNPDRTPNQVAIDNNITSYPTWVFPDGSRLEGVQSLQVLSQRSGVPIPTSSTVHLPELGNVNVGIGSPLYVPIDAFHPAGTPLTITVTSSNPSLISASVQNTNRSMRIKTDFGDMVFELFEDKAPRPTSRVIELAEDGFYDGIIFHRVIDGFMIQGGDPTGTGTSGSPLGNFDDQFHLDLQHNRSGVLSFAKSGDDTNNSQFFITAGPTRHLDFNHSVFGQLVEGDAVRNAIGKTATNSADKPLNNVVMREVTIFNDTENGLVFLKPVGTGTGTATITVNVSDGQGNSISRSFVATVVADSANGGPFLNDIPVLQANAGTLLNYTLTSQDAEGDPVIYSVERVGSQQYELSVNAQTGVVSLTPPNNFTGQLQFMARVRPATSSTTQDTFDSQLVTVQVTSAATLGLTLDTASDSGSSNSDGVTNATSLVFSVTGTTSGATIEVLAGGQVVGVATASGSTTQVTVQNASAIAEGSVVFSARQRVNNQTNATSSNLNLTLDRTQPASLTAGVFPATVIVGAAMNVDLNHPEENQGLRYTLTNAPAGMTIGNVNGQVQWTPVTSQIGAQSFTVVMTDLAGNQRNQSFSINVGAEPLLEIRLATVSPAGAGLSTIQVGQQFKVQVFVEDLRTTSNRDGVFSAYMDLVYDPSVIQPIATSPINHVEPYTGGRSGTVASNRIQGLGANATSIDPLGSSERLFAEVTFVAIASGNAGLRTEPSSDPTHDIGLYNKNDAVASNEVLFGTSNFVVGLNYQVNNDVFNFDEDTGPHSLNVLANDTVETGVVLTIVEVGTPSDGGTVSIAGDGKSLTYKSAANFHGAETLTYTVANAQGVRQTATVTIQVTDVNDPPLAVNDNLVVFQNSALNVLDVLANDTQGADEGVVETLSVTQVTSPGSANGTITIGPSGLNVRYTPVPGFIGTETFNYTISDGRGGTSTATVTVTVRSLVPPPTAQDDSFTLVEDSPSASYNVLLNDSPVESSHTLTIREAGKSTVGSTTSVSSDGKFLIYKPAANFAGQEIITYTLEASDGGIATGRVTFTVTNVDDPPTAADDTLTVESSGGPVVLNVLSNDSDVDPGSSFTITSVTQPSTGSGTVAITGGGQNLTYTPPSNSFDGQLSFTYTITDNTGLTDSATVNLTVRSFKPRSILGKVQYAQASAAGVPLSQIQVSLSGTSATGTPVNLNATVATDGSYSFPNLAPGEYRVSRPALAFFVDNGEEVVIQSGPDDGNHTANFVVNSTLHPSHIELRDFLGSTFRKTLTAAIDSAGATRWLAPSGTWSSLTGLSFQVNTSNLTINATNSSSQPVTANVPLTHNLLSRTTNGSTQLIKLRGDTSKFSLAPVTTSAAEGESASQQAESAAASQSPLQSIDQTLTAEGEGASSGVGPVENIHSLTTVQSAESQTLVASNLPPTDVLRALLGSNQSRMSAEGQPTMAPASVDSALQEMQASESLSDAQLGQELAEMMSGRRDDRRLANG